MKCLKTSLRFKDCPMLMQATSLSLDKDSLVATYISLMCNSHILICIGIESAHGATKPPSFTLMLPAIDQLGCCALESHGICYANLCAEELCVLVSFRRCQDIVYLAFPLFIRLDTLTVSGLAFRFLRCIACVGRADRVEGYLAALHPPRRSLHPWQHKPALIKRKHVCWRLRTEICRRAVQWNAASV